MYEYFVCDVKICFRASNYPFRLTCTINHYIAVAFPGNTVRIFIQVE